MIADHSPRTSTAPAWAAEPADQLDWSPVAAAMERAASAADDPTLFEVSQLVAIAASDHADYREGCGRCDSSNYDRCPTWQDAQRLMHAWMLTKVQ